MTVCYVACACGCIICHVSMSKSCCVQYWHAMVTNSGNLLCDNCIARMLSEYRMLGALGVLNSFSFSSALEKEDFLDRFGSKLVIPANISD